MTRLIPTLVLATALAATAFPAFALNPIDDFEVGFFSLWTTRGNACAVDTVPIGWYESHCIWQERRVTLCGMGDQPNAAYLDVGSQYDDMVRFFPGGNSNDFLRLYYNWGFPRTLTYGGSLNRIRIDLRQGVPGGFIVITIGDANTTRAAIRGASTHGIIEFPFSEFAGLNLEQAMWMQIDIVSSGVQGAFEVADIRLRGDGYWGPARTVNFEGDFVAVEFPPLPSPPLSFRMTDPEGNWLYRTDLVVTRADGGPTQSFLRGEWVESAALGGEVGGIHFMGVEPTPFVDTHLEMSVELGTAGRLGPIPGIIASPTLSAGPSGFLIAFPVQVSDPQGNEIGRSETRILFDVHEGQALSVADVELTPGGPSQHAASGGFGLSFTLDVTGDVDLSEPLFEAMWIADWAPRSATGLDAPHHSDPTAPAKGDAMVLTAWPSVTREGAEIRASLPFAADGAIEILDVSGRLVRTIAAPRGAPSVRWDGRDDRGALTASGPFFARAGGRDSRPTRIVRVR